MRRDGVCSLNLAVRRETSTRWRMAVADATTPVRVFRVGIVCFRACGGRHEAGARLPGKNVTFGERTCRKEG